MMPIIFRRLVVALSVLAFVSGMTVQAVPSARALGMSSMAGDAKEDPECPRIAMGHHNQGMPIPAPCKGTVLDCVKQMGCLGTPALPDRFDAVSRSVIYSFLSYWAPWVELSGRDVAPDLVPPIAG